MICVCILTHNRIDKVKVCLESIYPGLRGELHILDQNSTDGTREWLQGWSQRKSNVHLTLSFQNLMAIGGRQRQVDMLRHRIGPQSIVVFLDSDVIAENQGLWLTHLKQWASVHGIAGVYGRNIFPQFGGFAEPDRVPGPCDVVSGGMTAVRGDVFLSGVEFDQAYLPFWHCDSDFCLSARAKGFKVYCVGNYAGLRHEPEHKKTDDQYYNNLNRLRDKWMGKGLIQAERVAVEASA